VTTLAGLGQQAAEAQTPAILVIGENVRLAEGLDWLGAATKGKALDPDPLKRNRLRDAG
jgi:uroporphyrin-III C-methyltransferase